MDRTWLDHQHEVGLRHHRAKKNQADGAHGVVPHISYRWIVAFLSRAQVPRPTGGAAVSRATFQLRNVL